MHKPAADREHKEGRHGHRGFRAFTDSSQAVHTLSTFPNYSMTVKDRWHRQKASGNKFFSYIIRDGVMNRSRNSLQNRPCDWQKQDCQAQGFILPISENLPVQSQAPGRDEAGRRLLPGHSTSARPLLLRYMTPLGDKRHSAQNGLDGYEICTVSARVTLPLCSCLLWQLSAPCPRTI